MSVRSEDYRSQFRWAVGLSMISGAAALAHQTLWTRRLVDILGASNGTFAKVVGVFFLGLSLGGWLASRNPVSPGRSGWIRVGWAELGIGLLALPIALGAGLGEWLASHQWLNHSTQWILPFLLMLPPATAMGYVSPTLLQHLSQQPGFLSSHALLAYSANTLGGVLGIAVVALYGVSRWGLSGTAGAASGCNLVLAVAALLLSRPKPTATKKPDSDAAQKQAANHHPPALSTSAGWVAAFLSGFAIMAQEVLLQHQFAQVTINSFFSSATVLSAVLLALGLASLALPQITNRLRVSATPWAFLIPLLAAVLCLAEPWLFFSIRPNLAILPYELSPMLYLLAVGGLCLIALVPPVFAGGLLFPYLLQFRMTESEPVRSQRIGLLIAVNGLGGWLGTEVGEKWLGPALGLWSSMAALSLVYASVGLIFLGRRSMRKGSTRVPLVLGAVYLIALLLGSIQLREFPAVSRVDGEMLVESGVGREGVVAVVRLAEDDWRILFNNSYTLGGSKAQMNQERQAHLPILLHGHAESVALLGVATGSTTAGAALHPEVKKIDAIELSPLALHYAETHFAPYNRDVFRHPAVRTYQEDARWVMASHPNSYDVIIGDLFLPWRTGEGRLFTREHFAATQRALKPNGVFCQWLPLFQLTRKQFEVITRTFLAVFPNAILLRGDFYTELPIVGLAGGRSFEGLDWEAISAACERLRSQPGISDGLVRHPEGVAMCLVGPLEAEEGRLINTLQNAWLEWDAGKNIVGLRDPWFIGIPCAERLRDAHRRGQLLLPEIWRAAHDSGQFFLTLEVAAKLNLGSLPALKAQTVQRLPPSLRTDKAIDWSQWPMRIKPSP